MIAIYEKALVCQEVFQFLQGAYQGEILLVTSRGTYLELDGRILVLTDETYGLTPIGIGIKEISRLVTSLSLKAGQPLSVCRGQLRSSGGTLQLQCQLVSESKAFLAPQKERILACASQLWERHDPRSAAGLCGPLLLDRDADLNVLCKTACRPLRGLLAALQAGEKDQVCCAVQQLIGLGIGLTPSLDDVMLGMLYTLLRLWRERAQLLRSAIEEYAPQGTHPISVAYLLAVAKGAPFARLDEILLGLSGQKALDIAPIISIGSSSGSEMLLGLLLAAQLTII